MPSLYDELIQQWRELAPGTLVSGPFYSDGKRGAGRVVARGRELWTRVGIDYVPVKVLVGDRASGGYRPQDLRPLER